MAITSDGTQAFGIQDSPVTINSVTYVAEALNFTYPANRVDINDSNGEPLGATIVPGRIEFSGTVQLASDATYPSKGWVLSTGGNTYKVFETGLDNGGVMLTLTVISQYQSGS